MKKESASFFCIRFGLKLEVMIPFVLADGGGRTSNAFWLSLIAAMLVAVFNNWFEELLTVLRSRQRRFLMSVIFGLIVTASFSALLIWWKIDGMLINPVASYGIGRTLFVIGALIIAWRIAFIAADETSTRNENHHLEAGG